MFIKSLILWYIQLIKRIDLGILIQSYKKKLVNVNRNVLLI